MIAALKLRLYRAVVDAEIRRYTYNLAALEQQMREDAKAAEITRGYLALAHAESWSDRYQGVGIEAPACIGVRQSLVWAYLALGGIGAAICIFA